MEKYLKILIGIALAFLLFFGLTSIFRGCGSSKDEATERVANMTRETTEAGNEDDLIDVSEFEGDINYSTNRDEIESVYIEDDINKVEEAPVVVSKPNDSSVVEPQPQVDPEPIKAAPVAKTNYKPAPVQKSTPINTYSGGRFMVLAGNYLVEKNAEHSADRLRRNGYNSEVVRFDNSRYFTVVAQRCNTRNAAVKISKTLKSKGIDNYIHTKN